MVEEDIPEEVEVVEEEIIPLKVNDIVPDLEIEYYDPKTDKFGKLKLYEDLLNKGKWVVLFFYPADFTFVCPTELEDLAEQYEKLKSMNVEVIAMSTDTVYSHLAWRKQEKEIQNVNYLMGADHNGYISRLFGIYEEESGLALRGTFIIDPKGKLVGVEINNADVGRNAEELVRKIEAFQYVETHPGEVCPAKWRKGMKTLKPSEQIVGKVYEALHQ